MLYDWMYCKLSMPKEPRKMPTGTYHDQVL